MLKKPKPTTSGVRHQLDIDRTKLHSGGPEKTLLAPGHKKRQGRGFRGHITVRHRGGGVKKRLRVIDWRRQKHDVPAKVVRLEYDPMRSAHLALLHYQDGTKAYILAPQGLVPGDEVMSGDKAEFKPGNALPLAKIPVGMFVHSVELSPGKGAQLARGAGTAVVIQSREKGRVIVQLPSKELRLINDACLATIGQVGNQDWKSRKIGKAGRKRLMGIRPSVRGTAQHPGSHPHGGGEGRSGVGLKHPKTPWGKPALGKKTRKAGHRTNKWIVRDRRSK